MTDASSIIIPFGLQGVPHEILHAQRIGAQVLVVLGGSARREDEQVSRGKKPGPAM